MFAAGDCLEQGDSCEIPESSKNFQESRTPDKQDILKRDCFVTRGTSLRECLVLYPKPRGAQSLC